MQNKTVKYELYNLCGKKCMITDYITDLTLHHILKQCCKGKTTVENGAVLFNDFHQYLHNVLENKNYQLFKDTNDLLIILKQVIITPDRFNEQDVEEIYEEKQKIKTLFLDQTPHWKKRNYK